MCFVHLQLPLSGARVCLYEDGTIVTEDFFPTLPDNSELVLLSKDQTWAGGTYKYFFLYLLLQRPYYTFAYFFAVVCDIGHLLNTDRHADALIEAAKGLLSDEKSSKRRKILTDLLQNLQDRSELEAREDDEDWFTGMVKKNWTC